VIDEHTAHYIRGDSKKLGTIMPVSFPLIDEAKIRLVNEGCCLKGVTVGLATHGMRGNATQLIVHERYELVCRSRVALTPRLEERSDIRSCGLRKI
jgi:hypothetical protein